jgi:c-di-AMP phosphodiesterase-like protein
MLNRIERGDVPAEYFRMLAVSLRNAQLIGRSIVTSLDDTHSPDMIAEIADLLLRHEGADWSLCLGFYEGRAIFSLRTSEGTASAGDVARQIADKEGTAGGHKTLAAGQISLERDDPAERTRLTQTIRERFLAATGDGSAQVHSLAGD